MSLPLPAVNDVAAAMRAAAPPRTFLTGLASGLADSMRKEASAGRDVGTGSTVNVARAARPYAQPPGRGAA